MFVILVSAIVQLLSLYVFALIASTLFDGYNDQEFIIRKIGMSLFVLLLIPLSIEMWQSAIKILEMSK